MKTEEIILGIAASAIDRIYRDFPPAYMGNRRWSHIKIIETAVLEALHECSPQVRGQDSVPCQHEWYQGKCIHCELSAKEWRDSK